MSPALLDYLRDAIVQGTLFAAGTWLLCATILRRARPSLHAALWTLAVLRFLIPAMIPVPWGDQAADPGGPVAVPMEPGPAATEAAPLWPAVIAAAYLLGLAVVGGLTVRRALRELRSARRLPVAPESLRARVAALAWSAGARRVPTVRVAEEGSPFVIGLWRPTLVVPRWLDSHGDEADAAILHELAHLRRRDPWVRVLQVAAETLFYFWPVVSRCNRALDSARELACDQWALQRAPVSRARYARFLLRAWRRSGPAAAPALAMAGGGALGRRIHGILHQPLAPRLGRRACALLCGWATLGLVGAEPARAGRPETILCVPDPEVGSAILARHPDADLDGDGELSRDEICAHQVRMQRRLVDGVVDGQLVSQMDPSADIDGDGVLSAGEVDAFKERVEVEASAARRAITLRVDDRGYDLRAPGLEVAAAEVDGPLCQERRLCVADPADPPDSLVLIDIQMAGAP